MSEALFYSFFLMLGISLISFLTVGYWWKPPVSKAGKLALWLLTGSAIGWACCILAGIDGPGHPPLWLVVVVVFWPINLLLVSMVAAALRYACKETQENPAFLRVAIFYCLLNAVPLILPIIWGIASALFN